MIDDKPLAEAVVSAQLALDEMLKGGDRKDLPELADYVERMASQIEAGGTNHTFSGELQSMRAKVALLKTAHDAEGLPLPVPPPAPPTVVASELPKPVKAEAWKAPPPAPVFDAEGKQVQVPPKKPVIPPKAETPKTPPTAPLPPASK